MSPGKDAHGHSGLDEMECLVPHHMTCASRDLRDHQVRVPAQMTDPEQRFGCLRRSPDFLPLSSFASAH